METKLNSHVNGPGLEPEDARKPSTSNLTTTLFKQKRFKELKDKAGVSNVQSRTASYIQRNDESVFLQPKSDVDLRMRYMSKLTYHQVWLAPTKQKKSHQNVIILDWDDTLLPTSFLTT